MQAPTFEQEEITDPRRTEFSETVIETRELTKRFGDINGVENITLSVPRGAIYGFIGPSGCGKTTTVRLMIGNYHPTGGSVSVLGKAPAEFNRADRKQIGYMPQLFILYPDLSVWENMHFAASIYGYSLRRKKRFNELLDLVELSGHERQLARKISAGMQRRLSLASTLIHNPPLIFLDEPTAGIDPVLRRKFWDYFRVLRDAGHTLFVTTQYVGEAAYCDYVAVMRQGRLLMVETPDALRYNGLGGDIVRFQTAAPLGSVAIEALNALPFVRSDAQFRGSRSVQLVVEDAGTAIPQLLSWSEDQHTEIESISEYVLPFDDVFVKIMQDEAQRQGEADNAVADDAASGTEMSQ
jgi:ABC-2 type transport system ATP-binding protein